MTYVWCLATDALSEIDIRLFCDVLLIVKPVCGCDGQTYTNDCFAARAGASVAHDGACN